MSHFESTLDPTGSVPTHDRLRAAAAELFAERGYGGTSMSEIAARVGVRKASLYNYYDSKEELLLELVEQSLRAWREASRPALEGPGSAEECLAGHLKAAVEFTAENPEKVTMLRIAATQIGGELGDRVEALLASMKEEYLARLERFFTEAMAAGEVEPADPLDLSLACRVFLDGLLSNMIFQPQGAGQYKQRLPRLWAVLWRGVSGREVRGCPEG